MQERKNLLYVFLIFLVLSASLFFLGKLPIFEPVSSVVGNIFSPFQSFAHNLAGGFGAASETKKLEEQNLSLSRRIVDQSKLAADNKALRDQFEIAYPKSPTLIPAGIIGAPSFLPGVTLPENFILNKGSKDGVNIGMAVVYKDNIVGKISKVSQNLSLVDLITNSNFSFTAQTLATQALGVVKGQGGGNMILDNVLLSQSLKQDDLVVTKGSMELDGTGILPGLVIGKIISVNKNPSDLFQVAKVQSLLDFTHLSTVYIVKGI